MANKEYFTDQNSGKTSFSKRINIAVGYAPLFFMFAYAILSVAVDPAFVVATVVYGWLTFRGTMDTLQGVGPVYWIIRKDPRFVSVGVGTMHETNDPWRIGRGIYIVFLKRCFQIGLCRVQSLDETEGILSAVQGRYLELEPREIGNWGVQEKARNTKLPA